MSIKCRHCGGRHSKVETVRQCAIDAGVPEDSLPVVNKDMWLPTLGPIEPVRHQQGTVPAGYYWLDEDIIVKIRIPAEGRWKGRYFISSCSRSSNTETALSAKDRKDFLGWLVGQPWHHYMVRYGANTKYCPACGGSLGMDRRKYWHDGNGPYGTICYLVVNERYVTLGG